MTQEQYLALRSEIATLRDNHRKWDSETHSSGVADQLDDLVDFVDNMWKEDGHNNRIVVLEKKPL